MPQIRADLKWNLELMCILSKNGASKFLLLLQTQDNVMDAVTMVRQPWNGKKLAKFHWPISVEPKTTIHSSQLTAIFLAAHEYEWAQPTRASARCRYLYAMIRKLNFSPPPPIPPSRVICSLGDKKGMIHFFLIRNRNFFLQEKHLKANRHVFKRHALLINTIQFYVLLSVLLLTAPAVIAVVSVWSTWKAWVSKGHKMAISSLWFYVVAAFLLFLDDSNDSDRKAQPCFSFLRSGLTS